MRLWEQFDADAASVIIVVCRKKLDMPSRYVVDSSVGTVGLDFHQTSRPTVTHSYRLLSRIDMATFCQNSLYFFNLP